MVYAIQAQVTYTKDGWRTSKGIATFFLDSNIQGIVSVEHAERIAAHMLQVTPDLVAHVTATECPDSVIIRGF